MKKNNAKNEKGSGKKGSKKIYMAAALVVVAVVAASLYLVSSARPPAPDGNYTVSVDDDPMMGNASAKVTLVEFSDFECPLCRVFAMNTFPQIKANYIDSGKVKFVFRDFIVHPAAQLAAEASECADEQGGYWEYNKPLFENQASLGAASLKAYAKELGLDTTQFDACLDSGKYRSEVGKDMSDGRSYGVRGTPTFFINGKKIVGVQPYEVFRQAIEAALNA